MTPAEILEAATLLKYLASLRASVAEMNFDDREIVNRRMTLTVKIEHVKNPGAYHDTLLAFSGHTDPETTAAILRIAHRRRREKLDAALRRLEQLGVRESK